MTKKGRHKGDIRHQQQTIKVQFFHVFNPLDGYIAGEPLQSCFVNLEIKDLRRYFEGHREELLTNHKNLFYHAN